MNFYLWGHVKGKFYVKNCKSLADLKSFVSATFRKVMAENVSASVRNLEKGLKKMIERAGTYIEQ